MGLLSDFFVATAEELTTVDVERGVAANPERPATKGFLGIGAKPAVPYDPGPGLPYVEAKGLTEVEMTTLEEILTGRPYAQIAETVDDLQVVSAGDEGPWIQLLRRDLIDALAAADEAAIDAAARRWAATAEMDSAADPEAIAALSGLIRELSELARQAVDGREMYLWTSL